MKTSGGFSRWGPAAGMLAVGFLAFSLSLEGAAPSPQAKTKDSKATDAASTVIPGSEAFRQTATLGDPQPVGPVRSGHAVSRASEADGKLPASVTKFGRLPAKDMPVFDTMVADYRDDSGTRLRQAGLLVGPYRPDQGAAAAGGCSFDIQCDDCNPCTEDICLIDVGDPIGSGTCSNSPLANGAEGGCSDGLCCNGLETCQSGACQAPGAGTGTFEPDACEFPCVGPNAGQVCNEDSGLCRPACDGTNFCAVSGAPCTTTLDCDLTNPDNYCKNCNDGLHCNGRETCVAGICEAGTPPCGEGALCGEKECSGAGVDFCTSDSDCQAIQAGNCTVRGPVCRQGRCCNNSTAEPSCTRRFFQTGTCQGSSNTHCLVAADCPGGAACNGIVNSCTGQGGIWYSSDDGYIDGTGTVCPIPSQQDPPNDRTICPKFSAGIAPLMDFDTDVAFLVGPVSQGPCDHDDIGDDYRFENNSPMALEKFRWIGGGGGRLLIEFFDENANFIEDVVTGAVGGAIGVRSIQFIPPLTIPARGYVVISVATNFAPNGQTVWAATDAVDEGINAASGANSLWIDGAPSSMTLRECVGGTNDGIWCDPSDLGDSECVGAGGVCTNRNNILAFELEGLKVPAPTGACCNDTTGACTNGVLPWVCTAQGNNYQGNSSTCPGNCGLGACCAANGTCSVTTSGGCAGTFQGFGTDCQPNCCTQPAMTGGDNCQDVDIHVIPVPPVGDPATVVTITGNNATASGPDTCLQGAWSTVGGTFLSVDPGWWEAFTIDSCAFVRVDFCCSNPVIEPAWALLWTGCPCDEPKFTAVNPNIPDEPANRRGAPYCEDDNLWNKFGPLPAGTYYIPVYSVPPGAHGQYQMHITVEACPTAACCDGAACIETDQLGCQNIDGANFLAPPFRTTATTTCQGATCATGSCCYVPGQALCVDVISGQLANQTLCSSSNGEYKGGARCQGCVCAAGAPAASCDSDDDCGVNGPCNNPGGGTCSGQNLTQPSPCPVCDFETQANCQPAFLGTSGWILSDLCSGDCISDPPATEYSQPLAQTADDFVASVGGSITSVCVVGQYVDQLNSLADCYDSGPPENFRVRIFNDAGGIPGTLVGSRTTTVTRKAVRTVSGGDQNVQYQLALSSPLPITQGNTYWLEVTNNTDESSGLPGCDWGWKISDPNQTPDKGNEYYMQDFGLTYTQQDANFGADLAWCLTISNTVPVLPEKACCTCSGGVGVCAEASFESCVQQDGAWLFAEEDCVGVSCRDTPDGPDSCSQKQVVTDNSDTPFNNFCTTTDGPASTGCGNNVAQNDLWYAFTAECDGQVIIETCDQNNEFDSVLAVYTDNTATCPCPTNSSLEVDCSESHGATGGFCNFFGLGARMVLPVDEGVCYTIRFAGYLGAKGEGMLHISDLVCDDPPPPVTPIPDPFVTPSTPGKTRFISFSVVGGGSAVTALRVKLTSLHHVVPPYPTGTSTPFTLFEGMSVWVGPPATYLESNATGIQFRASTTQCTPHYRDWNTVGLLHVTGAHILPSSIYDVENVSAACQGVEGTAGCAAGSGPSANVSDNLPIVTTRWGDVEIPYNPPSTTAQPDVGDISALVNKFRSALGAPIKARALLTGGDAFGNINITPDMSFGHIAACVDGFRGLGYPFKPGKCATSNVACISNSECGANGPCNLYCP